MHMKGLMCWCRLLIALMVRFTSESSLRPFNLSQRRVVRTFLVFHRENQHPSAQVKDQRFLRRRKFLMERYSKNASDHLWNISRVSKVKMTELPISTENNSYQISGYNFQFTKLFLEHCIPSFVPIIHRRQLVGKQKYAIAALPPRYAWRSWPFFYSYVCSK